MHTEIAHFFYPNLINLKPVIDCSFTQSDQLFVVACLVLNVLNGERVASSALITIDQLFVPTKYA